MGALAWFLCQLQIICVGDTSKVPCPKDGSLQRINSESAQLHSMYSEVILAS